MLWGRYRSDIKPYRQVSYYTLYGAHVLTYPLNKINTSAEISSLSPSSSQLKQYWVTSKPEFSKSMIYLTSLTIFFQFTLIAFVLMCIFHPTSEHWSNSSFSTKKCYLWLCISLYVIYRKHLLFRKCTLNKTKQYKCSVVIENNRTLGHIKDVWEMNKLLGTSSWVILNRNVALLTNYYQSSYWKNTN